MFVANLPSLLGDGALLARRRRRVVESERLRLFGRGRQALAALVGRLGYGPGMEVLLPASLCSEAIWPFLRAGVGVRYYGLDSALNPDVLDLESKIGPRVRAIYIVHYYGMRATIEPVRELCSRKGLTFIEDCALCLFDGQDNGGVGRMGDYAVFSPWKYIAVPDGGILMSRHHDLQSAVAVPPHWMNTVRFAASGMIHGVRQVFPGFATAPESNDETPSGAAESVTPRRMSALSRYVLERIDFARVRGDRLRNYRAMAECVVTLGVGRLLFASLPEGSIPYSLPIVVDDAAALQRRLRSKGVASEVSLSRSFKGHDGVRNAGEVCAAVEALASHVLSLPIHQSIGPAQLAFMAKALRAAR